MQTFTTPAPVTAVLDLPAATVRLVTADGAGTTVEVLPADASKGRDVKAAERVAVTFEDGVLRIATPAPKNPVLGTAGTAAVTVHLPAGSRVEVKAAAAELRGVGRLGEVDIEAAQGSVRLDEAAGARIALLAGDVVVGRLGGPGEISTRKGDIGIAEAVRGTVTLRTELGDITVGAAAETSAILDAGTAHGRVRNALKNTDGAAAGLTVHATTAYGDITARSL